MIRAACVLGLVALCAASCSGAQRSLPAAGPQTASALRAALRPPKAETLQGQGRLEAYVRDERRSVNLLVLAKRPASVQFQALAPTLDMLAVLSTDGRRFTSFERGGASCLVGAACPANMARLLPISLPPEQLVATLLGDPPIAEVAAADQRLGWDGDRGLYRLELGPADGPHQHVYVQPGTLRPAGAVWYVGARRLASVQYDGEVTPQGPPRWIRVKASEPPADVTIELRDVQVDQPLDDEAFAITCPSGMVVRELPCQAAKESP